MKEKITIRQSIVTLLVCTLPCLGVNRLKSDYCVHKDALFDCPNTIHHSNLLTHGSASKWCTANVMITYQAYSCNYAQEYEKCVKKAWDECMDWALAATQNGSAGAAMGAITRVGGTINRGIAIGGAVGAGMTYLGNVGFCLVDSEYRKAKKKCKDRFVLDRDNLRRTRNNQISAIVENAADTDASGYCDDCEDAIDAYLDAQ